MRHREAPRLRPREGSPGSLLSLLEPTPARSTWRSPLDPDTIAARLDERALLQDHALPLTWKLSGAGIVGRVMDVPHTDRPLVGRCTPFGWELVRTPEPTHRHAFEPIAEVRVESAGRGSTVELLLRMHREQHSFALPFALMGAACCGSAVVAWTTQPVMAGLSLTIGLAFALLPPARSRALFRHGVRQTEAALTEHLELQAAG